MNKSDVKSLLFAERLLDLPEKNPISPKLSPTPSSFTLIDKI